jgi:hypothetical protein
VAQDTLIVAAGQASVPETYTVPNAQEISPLVVRAVLDGTLASGSFLPVLELISDGGIVFAQIPAEQAIAVGGQVEVTWAPGLFGQADADSAFATAAIAASANGNNTLVAGVAAKRIRVKRVSLMASGNVTVTFADSHGNLTGGYPLVASTGFVMGPDDDEWWFQTTAGDPLILNLSGAVAVGGVVGFELI